jgi:GNAT superfamily N-acetyltransferase
MGGVLPSAAGHDEERRVEGAAALHRMRVAPTHQGRGYGRAILDALEAAARERGFDVVLATTARTQPRAVAFYPAAGYDLVGESTAAGYELVHYEKRLGD